MYTCEGGWSLVQPETGGRNDVFAIGSQHNPVNTKEEQWSAVDVVFRGDIRADQ